MATPNYGSIPQQTLSEVTLGIVQEEESFADRICRVRTDIETLKGNAPFLSSVNTVRLRENVDLAPGVAAKPAGGGFGVVAYDCLRQTGFSEIFDESQISASAYSIDLVAHWVREAVKQANTNADFKFETVLASTVLNTEWDVTTDGTGDWSDLTNATPLSDIEKAGRTVPGKDTAIIGSEAVSLLQNHPQTQGRLSGYAKGTVAFIDEVRALIAGVLRIRPENVHILDDAIYNEGTETGYVTGFLFNGGMWIGKRDDLQLFDPQNEENRKSEIDRKVESAKYLIAHHRYVDVVRHVKETAVTLTNILP